MRTASELHADLEQARTDVSRDLEVMIARLQELTRPRAWVRRRPLLFVAGAFALGVALGLRAERSREDERNL